MADCRISLPPRAVSNETESSWKISKSAGPLASFRWNSRFSHEQNRKPKEGVQNHFHIVSTFFAAPCLDTFLNGTFGQGPAVIDVSLPSNLMESDLKNKRKKTYISSDEELCSANVPSEMSGWLCRTAYFARRAARGGKRKGRLAVVDPADKERKTVNPGLQTALDSYDDIVKSNVQKANTDLAVSLWKLSQSRLVAVRDVHIEDEGINTLRNSLSELFQCCVTTNLYMSGSATSVGFVEHHDNHDVIAIQLHGKKKWFVGPPILRHPSTRYDWRDDHNSPPDDMKCFETVPGTALYMPAGWRHYAQPGDDSVHLTMGLQIPRWSDAIDAASHAYGAFFEELRRPLPGCFLKDKHIVSWDISDLSNCLRQMADCIDKNKDALPTKLETPCGASLNVDH
eukprot:m.14938 g.14938  ORF g.14938 m.14938 type:complete len:398 (-) comp5255_c0_seq1:716-1909(-)